MKISKLIRADFLPHSTDAGLLLLRVWLGLGMFLIHGLGKLQTFNGTLAYFHDYMGIPKIFAVAAILAESIASVLLVIGFATRWAALTLAITMTVAFVLKHEMILQQGHKNSGEIAFLYLGGFLAILVAGAGRWSVDAKLGR